MKAGRLYPTIWRWHFYAGLFVIPFVLLLAVTGGFYLFKPQVERWEERAYRDLPVAENVLPQQQLNTALAAFPGARFDSYRLPRQAGDAAMIHLAMPDGRSMRDVFISPQGELLGSMDSQSRIMEVDKRIHGQLLMGARGSWLVELVACWAIFLILSGLYLWWPRDRMFAGVIWPRLKGRGRVLWRDLHAVTGFWISGLVLALLITGLPWTSIWGGAFSSIRTELGLVKGAQEWTLGGEAATDEGPRPPVVGLHPRHDHAAMMAMMPPPNAAGAGAGIDNMVARAREEALAFPVIITPPGGPGRFGAPGPMAWTIRSDAAVPPQRTSITYDAATGQEISRDKFADSHIIDRAVGYGIAWHEGQLFGWISQAVGVITATGLILMAVSGFVMWRRRKPADALGAPSPSALPARMGGVAAILLFLAALLPLLMLWTALHPPAVVS
jgi:uncharacterized iron-regulated membrane protein|tara:strand:- start:10538 stop:11863 length:1326 start_codon:yes stop_codon:yes gene_type:complete